MLFEYSNIVSILQMRKIKAQNDQRDYYLRQLHDFDQGGRLRTAGHEELCPAQ